MVCSLGPIAAISVLSTMLAGLTLLPALLTWFGRAAFWPRAGTVAYEPASHSDSRRGAWRRFGDKFLQRPGPVLAVTSIVFIAGAFGVLAYKADFSTTSFFKTEQESIQGFDVISEEFPAGTLDPGTAIVIDANGPVSDAGVDRGIRGPPRRGPDRTRARAPLPPAPWPMSHSASPPG